MNASMEAVLCLNLVADKKGHPVDIKLFQKMAGAKVFLYIYFSNTIYLVTIHTHATLK